MVNVGKKLRKEVERERVKQIINDKAKPHVHEEIIGLVSSE